MFWAVQGMAAELSTGIPIIHEVNNRKIRVSMLVTSNSSKFYKKAVGTLSLSKMTFSHQMVRLFVIEQLYRGFTILKNEPYHHR